MCRPWETHEPRATPRLRDSECEDPACEWHERRGGHPKRAHAASPGCEAFEVRGWD
ncbi:unnamed protein product [Effrenium voratum]|nr:unnamed protein product [Effrenium voratum]